MVEFENILMVGLAGGSTCEEFIERNGILLAEFGEQQRVLTFAFGVVDGAEQALRVHYIM